MAQTLNGHYQPNDIASYAWNVGQWRLCAGNWNFTDDTGAQGAYTIFTVTGDIAMTVNGVCQTDLTSGGAATIELGIVGNTAQLIAQTTATDLDQYEKWQDATPETNPGFVNAFGTRLAFIAGGTDVILTIATADLTAGDIDFYAFWMPLSIDGNCVAV